jgi:uncharacterized membrane protein YozB (DUF420 family)
VPSGADVILTLKVAVVAVTCLLLASLVALARGNYRLHGRLNIAFFALTSVALLGLEILVRLIDPRIFDYFDEEQRANLRIHLCFSLPATAVMVAMLYTGLNRRRDWHLYLAGVFSVLWVGTFITGVFFLPHRP